MAIRDLDVGIADVEGRVPKPSRRQSAPPLTRPRSPESRGLGPVGGQSVVVVGHVTRPLTPNTELAGVFVFCTTTGDGPVWTSRLGRTCRNCRSSNAARSSG